MIDCGVFYELFCLKWEIYNCFPSSKTSSLTAINKKEIEKYCLEIVEFIGYLPECSTFFKKFYAFFMGKDKEKSELYIKLMATSRSDLPIEW
jgi:hypothetical protein